MKQARSASLLRDRSAIETGGNCEILQGMDAPTSDLAPAAGTLFGIGPGCIAYELFRAGLGIGGLIALRRRLQHLVDDETGVLAHSLFDLDANLGMLLEKRLGVLAPLADALPVEGKPCTGFLDNARLHAEIHQLTGLGDALAVHDVEFDLLEGWCHLVLDHLYPGLIAYHFLALFDLADAADVEAHGSVKLERVPTGGCLRVPKHDADLHADLVDKDHHALGLGDGSRQLAQRLAHQAGLHPGLHLAHLSLE